MWALAGGPNRARLMRRCRPSRRDEDVTQNVADCDCPVRLLGEHLHESSEIRRMASDAGARALAGPAWNVAYTLNAEQEAARRQAVETQRNAE